MLVDDPGYPNLMFMLRFLGARLVGVPRTPAEVFPFFSDPWNLEKLTPAFLRFRVLSASTPRLGEGTRIDYRLSLRGLPVRWQSRIDSWEPDRCFVDSQVRHFSSGMRARLAFSVVTRLAESYP